MNIFIGRLKAESFSGRAAEVKASRDAQEQGESALVARDSSQYEIHGRNAFAGYKARPVSGQRWATRPLSDVSGQHWATWQLGNS